jgi:transposase
MANRHSDAMHVDKIVRRHGDRVYVSHVIRSSYREDGKVKHDQVANISRLPPHLIEVVSRGLAGEAVGVLSDGISVEQSWLHGHVAAVLGTARRMDMAKVIDAKPSRKRDLVLGMIVARVLDPASKLATTGFFRSTTLGKTLGIEGVTEDDLYGAMDWLVERQEKIERRLAKRHLEAGGVVLYDLTSVYVEGEHCELAQRGYSRDGKPGHLQIEFGLMTNAAGEPVAIEVFPGNTGDPKTFPAQVTKVQERFGVKDVIWVGDRGMVTSAQVRLLEKIAGLSWVTALRAPSIRQLLDRGSLQLSLFDTQNLAEVTDPRFPGERLVICHNPAMESERARKREELLQATERELAKVAAMAARGASGRGRLRGEAKIGERVGRVVNKYNMAKHFRRVVTDTSFSFERDHASIAEEAKLDGFYVIRTNVKPERMSTADVVETYKGLEQVERAFRHFKLQGLQVRPIYHRLDRRIRAHLLICMLSYSIQRRMEHNLAPLLFVDEDVPARSDPVAPAGRSHQAQHKDQSKRAKDGYRIHSFRALMKELESIVKNRIRIHGTEADMEVTTRRTPLQTRAFQLLGVSVG